MRAHRQQAQHIFRAELGRDVGPPRAVQGRQHQHAARFEQSSQIGDEALRVRHVLDHLQRRHGGEACAFRQQRLGGHLPIGETGVQPLGMRPRRADHLGPGIHPEHIMPKPRQRLRRQTGAAAHIQQAHRPAPGGANPPVHPADPQRIHRMQRCHRPAPVPPARSQAIKSRDLVSQDARHDLKTPCWMAQADCLAVGAYRGGCTFRQ